MFSLAITNPKIALPIGISFFTFTQTAYIVDVYRHDHKQYGPMPYGLFVTYFPHLVAGPIIHHAQVMPQLLDPLIAKPRATLITLGLVIFTMGLFKKIILADGISTYADAIFNEAAAGRTINAVEGWTGALAYTFQLYFDFSGYSDMAIGLSWMLGVALPYNFNSPYKALSIADFWRRWHMTLSSFLRDYLYIALGGNRKGNVRRNVNLLTTMLLGGFWHGAGWTFIIWGALHGTYLVINHAWRDFALKRIGEEAMTSLPYRFVSWLLTFIAVVHAWVFFRATSVDSALSIIAAMWSGRSGSSEILDERALDISRMAMLSFMFILVVLVLPNTNEIGERLAAYFKAVPKQWPYWLGGALTCSLFLVLINALRGDVSPFIYFNF